MVEPWDNTWSVPHPAYACYHCGTDDSAHTAFAVAVPATDVVADVAVDTHIGWVRRSYYYMDYNLAVAAPALVDVVADFQLLVVDVVAEVPLRHMRVAVLVSNWAYDWPVAAMN